MTDWAVIPPTPTSKALDAIEDRVASLAAEATADDLVKLADAMSKIMHGPQGGRKIENYKSISDNTTTYAGRYGVDNTHASAEDKRPTGFSS